MLRKTIFVFFGLSVVIFLLGPGASRARAHAILQRADPPDGAVLSAAPKQVTLWFSEPVSSRLTTAELIDSNGKKIPVRAVRPVSQDNAILAIDLPELSPGLYQLTWQAYSDDDLHLTNGEIVFGIQHPAESAAISVNRNTPQAGEVFLRWASLIGLAGLLGCLAVALIVFPAIQNHPSILNDPSLYALSRRLAARECRTAIVSGLVALAAGGGLLWLQSASPGLAKSPGWNAFQEILTHTSYGSHWLIKQGLVVAMIGLAVFGLRGSPAAYPERRGEDGRSRVLLFALHAILLLLALALAWAEANNSHAVAFNQGSAVRVAAYALHLLAAGLWAGGLLGLAVMLAPLLPGPTAERSLARFALQGFSPLAAGCMAVLVITGLYNSGWQVASLDALLFTLYGRTLLWKAGLVVVAGLFGLYNSARLQASLAGFIRWANGSRSKWLQFDPRRLRGTLLAESAAGLGILLLAALLGATQPGRGPEFDLPPADSGSPSSATLQEKDLVVSLSVKPNQPGQNFVSVGVYNTRRPAPGPIDQVAIQFTSPGSQKSLDQVFASSPGDGQYHLPTQSIEAAGPWQISVVIRRQGLADTLATFPWTVNQARPAVARRPVVISNRPLAPILNLAAVLITVLLGIAWIAFREKGQSHIQSPGSASLIRSSRKE